LFDFSLAELTEFVDGLGERPFRARQLYGWMYGKGVTDFEAMTDIPAAARAKLGASARLDALKPADALRSKDGGTSKFLLETSDGHFIETVFMKYKDRNSICVSSQVGCRMGCRFCASGALGFRRNLTAGEMCLEAILSEQAAGARAKNIVLMGIGEPLDNYDNVRKFVENMTDDHGRDMSRRAITLSTCGVVPMMARLAEELPQVNLAVSLHAPNDRLREQIMPVTKRWKVADIVAAVRRHYEATRRRPTFEYALIEGFNDSPAHAKELAALLRGMNCLVNLIPLNGADGAGGVGGVGMANEIGAANGMSAANGAGAADGADAANGTVCPVRRAWAGSEAENPLAPARGTGKTGVEVFRNTLLRAPTHGTGYRGSTQDTAQRFREILGGRNVPATVRRSLGADIEAACGQLRLRKEAEKQDGGNLQKRWSRDKDS